MGCAVLIVSTQIGWQLTLLRCCRADYGADDPNVTAIGCMIISNWRRPRFSSLNDRTQESLTSIRAIKAFGLEGPPVFAVCGGCRKIPARKICAWRVLTHVLINHLHRHWHGEPARAISGGSWMVVNGGLTLGELTSFI